MKGAIIALGALLAGGLALAFGSKKASAAPGTPSWARMGDQLQAQYLEAVYSSDPFKMLQTATDLEAAGFPAEANALRGNAMMTAGWGEPEPLEGMSDDLRYQVLQALTQGMLSGEPGLILQVADVVEGQGFVQLGNSLRLFGANLAAIRANRASRQTAPPPPGPVAPPQTSGRAWQWNRRW